MASEELKQEAKDLGIEFSPNIGDEKLQAKIDAYYESQETSGKELQEAVKATEEKEAETKKPALSNRYAKAKVAEEKARKTRVVTIIDNDRRVNNQTSSCVVNCSNMYFDLGTMILPLNTPVEVMQGHLNVLKEVRIPQHIQDRDGLSHVEMRPRYTISYEDVEK